MQAQTYRNPKPNHVITTAIIAIGIAIAILLSAAAISDYLDSNADEAAPAAQQPAAPAQPQTGAVQARPILDKRPDLPVRTVEDVRFVDENLYLPSQTAAAPRLSTGDILFLEENLFLPGGGERPETLLRDEIIFLEENIFTYQGKPVTESLKRDEMRFLEENVWTQ